MRKFIGLITLFVTFSFILSACANAAPTLDAGQAATQVAAQVEAQVSTRVAQAMAAFEATQRAQSTTLPIIPTIGSIPTLAPVNLPTVSLPGVATGVPCNATPANVGENYPDGTSIYINTSFNKAWSLKNMGTCTWNANYKIKFLSGDSMSGPSYKLFGANVAPGDAITLTLPLKTPGAAGTTTGYWGLYDDKDAFFGQVWVTINSVIVAPTSSAFGVTSVSITGALSTCIFSASITTNGGGSIKYHWVYSSNAGATYTTSVIAALTFTGAGTKIVTTHLPGALTYLVHMYIDTPNHVQFYHNTPFICT